MFLNKRCQDFFLGGFRISFQYMKLRIHGNSVRLRLSQSEVAALAENGKVESYIEFGKGSQLTYALSVREDVSEPEARFENSGLTVYVPKEQADKWINSDSVGVTDGLSNDGTGPQIIVEKDFTCLHKRAGVDDADTFPNPEANRLF
jgi:hypothetical protein